MVLPLSNILLTMPLQNGFQFVAIPVVASSAAAYFLILPLMLVNIPPAKMEVPLIDKFVTVLPAVGNQFALSTPKFPLLTAAM
jgi:hypothetical protein